jgi:NAD(P)-dependent dehydrogenase (short-subunit alcohol dehydrogenase family)
MSEKKVVVITGVSRGLGRAMMTEFAASGHVVAGCSRSEKPLAEIRAKLGTPHLFSALDVCDLKRVESWAAEVSQKVGVPDLVVNNAALINRSAPLWELSGEEFSDVIDVNIKGVFNVIHAFLPAMLRKEKGVIVNFSSGWGRSTSPEVAPYCATKWAIEGLTQALAQELPDGLAAVPLNPGIIDTEMLRSCFGDGADSYPKPEAWAKRAVPFLLSLNAGHNGQSLSVPGAALD